MKSLFSRFKRDDPPATPPPSKQPMDQSNASGSRPTQAARPGPTPIGPPRRSSTPIAAVHSQSSSSSNSTRPRSEIDPRTNGYASGQLAPPAIWEEGGDVEGTVRLRTMSGVEGAVKKVTFRSPVPTQIDTNLPDSSMPPPPVPEPGYRARTSSFRLKSNGATSPSKPSRPSPVLSNAGSRSASRQSLPTLPALRKSSLGNTSSSGHGHESPTKSTDSSLPSHGSFDATSARSYLPPPNSWSEMAEDDLIANLGPRERTRQEVLWEIVSSEERYVQELIKLNETFCRYLLPPSTTSPSLSLFDLSRTLSHALSPSISPTPGSPTESFDHLPIAARYASPSLTQSPLIPSARLNAYNALTLGQNGGPIPNRQASSNTLNQSARAHQSLPPPPRSMSSGNQANSRMSYQPGYQRGKLTKSSDSSRIPSSSSTSSFVPGKSPLPEDLEKVLLAVAGGILEGHIKLAAALRKRYENQYPLVRSLADVFTSHSYILREYATYVLHLEKALSQVDAALATYTQSLSRRSSRRLEDTDFGRLGKTLIALEELAAERGESGLVISLSKPFQRLLKYPLLFQNLLFNTDPSLKEYEATLKMVDDVEEIVRSIEDEKASSEEREKTRDVWARIEGLERDKMLMAPKPNRLLVSETQAPADPNTAEATAKAKKSFRRLSDILKGSGSSSDLWVVRFSDVSLLCERTGLTHLPLSSFKPHSGRSDSLPELNGRAKYATTGKRSASIRARNLYRFVKVHEWHLRPKQGDTKGVLSMADISRARASQEVTSTSSSTRAPISSNPPSLAGTPRKVPLKGDGGPSPARSGRRDRDTDTVVSENMSVMSFAFKGSDQIRPNPKRTTKPIAPPSNTANRALQPRQAVAERKMSGQSPSAANAKFANRLRSPDENGEMTVRLPSKARRSLPPAMLARSGPIGSPALTSSPALSPTDRNTPSGPTRNGMILEERPARVSDDSENSENSRPKPDEPGSGLPVPVSPQKRGIKGTAPPSTTTSTISKRRSQSSLVSSRIQSFERPTGTNATVGPQSGRMVNGLTPGNGRGLANSASKDSTVGLWTTYRDGGIVGTPIKAGTGAPSGSRQFGGRV